MHSRAISVSAELRAAAYIGIWIAFSGAVILFNKYILFYADFPFPILLTTWHMLFATIVTRTMKLFGYMEGAEKREMTWRTWSKTVLPIGVLFSSSLIFANYAYLYLSVAFIQMLKAFTPVAVMIIGWIFPTNTSTPDSRTIAYVTLIVAGVVVASYGEIAFAWLGFLFQVVAIWVEASRLILVERLMRGNLKMDPMTSLYFFAPVCFVVNSIAFLFLEAPKASWEDVSRVGFGLLFANGLVTFGLNVAVVMLINKTSSLVLCLAGIFKDILLVGLSALLWRTHVTLPQFCGYGTALYGLYKYKTKNMAGVGKAEAVGLPLDSDGKSLGTFRTGRRLARIFLPTLFILFVLQALWASSPRSSISLKDMGSTNSTLPFGAKPKGLKINAVVFVERVDRLRILETYIERNLADNGGWLDAVQFISNSQTSDASKHLDTVVRSNRRYTQMPSWKAKSFFQSFEDFKPNEIYIKIGSDIVYIHDDTIPAITRELLSGPWLAVSANVVNHPLLTHVHARTRALRPYVPEKVDQHRTATWRVRDVRAVDITDKHTITAPGKNDNYRMTRIVNHSGGLEGTAGTAAFYDNYGPTQNNWTIASIAHYSLFENLQEGHLRSYDFGVWDFHALAYKPWSISFFAIRGKDLLRKATVVEDDEVFISTRLPSIVDRHCIAVGKAVVADFSTPTTFTWLDRSDILLKYKFLAEAVRHLNKTIP